ncbi:MAG: hypothetical protein KGZ70_07025 [Hydrogenophaga sp.]|nr:hypothetical protein [Hydrogenophaga sp.]
MIQNPVRRQVLLAAVIIALAALLWASASLHATFIDALQFSKDYVESQPLVSRLAFVVLAALSAMLVLFSSIAVVPVAVYAWGQGETLLLLTGGWFLGANLAYLIGHLFGRRATLFFVPAETLDHYAELLSVRMSVAEVALLKLALPSEMPSFALGIMRYPLTKFWPVLLASELPFALWAVYLSAALIENRFAAFVAVLLAGLAVAAVIGRRLLRRR